MSSRVAARRERVGSVAVAPRSRRTVPPRTVLKVAAAGVFMAFVDNTIVTIAFPNMLKSFPHATVANLSWVFNIYNIALAALLVPAGRMADLLGRRKIFAAGVALFTVSSGLCAIAPSIGFLIAARVLQGAGAAILIPASLALVLNAYPGEGRAHAVALWAATGGLAAGIGPSIGGLLVVLYNWRLVFLVNLPIGVVVWRAANRRLVESRAPGVRKVPDLFGALLLAIAIALLCFAIVQSGNWGWLDARTVAALAGAAAAGVWFVRRSRHHPAPILDLELLTGREFSATSVLTVIGGAGLFAMGLTNVLYLINLWGYSPLVAGLAATPAPFVGTAATILAGRFTATRDPRRLITLGALVWVAGAGILIARFTVHADYLTAYLPAALVLAVGIGTAIPLVSRLAVSSAPGGRYAVATATNTAIRQLGGALGIAILASIVVAHDTGPGAKAAFQHAWLFSAICFAALAVISLALPRFTRSEAEVLADPDAGTRTWAAPPRTRATSSIEALRTGLQPSQAPQSTEEFLAEVPLFASLPAQAREALAAATTPVSVAAGTWLFRQGDDADALYVIRSGRLEVVDETPGRAPSVLQQVKVGGVLGELGLICATQRNASVRVVRDARLLRLGRDEFEAIMVTTPAMSRPLLRTVGGWLTNGRDGRPEDARPAAIAVIALDPAAASAEIDALLAVELSGLATTVHLSPDQLAGSPDVGHALAEQLDRLERDHDHIVLAGGRADSGDRWTEACRMQADRVVLTVTEAPPPDRLRSWSLPAGCDVVLLGGPADDAMVAMLHELHPRSTYRVGAGDRRGEDVAAMARRLAGRSVGLVLSGGGARSFTEVGVIEELLAAGIRIDRIGGTSMGAFIGALLAQGLDAAEIDARMYEEFVRRTPVGDYRFPRHSLLRGNRARAMLLRNMPGRIEDLPRSYFSVSVDILAAQLVRHRLGSLAHCVAASMALPIFFPPLVFDGRILLDGGLMENMPTEAMAADREGPIIAVDVTEPPVRNLPDGVQPTPPTLAETIYRIMLLSSSDGASRQSFADLLIRPDYEGIGILEFHMLDRMRETGRRAAAEALERAPASIFG